MCIGFIALNAFNLETDLRTKSVSIMDSLVDADEHTFSRSSHQFGHVFSTQHFSLRIVPATTVSRTEDIITTR